MWRVQTESGESFGPVARPQLDAWVKEGKVTRWSRLQFEGGQWQTAEETFPLLAQTQPPRRPPTGGLATGDAEPTPVLGYSPPPGAADGIMDATDYNEYGVHFLQQGNWQSAEKSLALAVACEPDYALAWHNRGHARQMGGQVEEALKAYTRAVELSPSNGSLYEPRALLLMQQGNRAGAIADFGRAICFEPQNAGLLLARGTLHRQEGDVAAAIADLRAAVALVPQHAEAQFQLAAALFESDKLGAAAHFDRAYEAGRKDAACLFGRGAAACELRRYRIAIPLLKEAARQAPDHAAAYHYLGVAHLRLGEIKEAHTQFSRAIEIGWQDTAASYRERGFACRRAKQYERAADNYAQSLRLSPADAETLRLQAEALAALGRREEAAAELKQAKQLISQTIKELHAAGGKMLVAALLDREGELWSPGERDGFCHALVSFEKDLRDNELVMYALADKARELALSVPDEPELQELAETLADPSGILHRRRKLANEFTGGPAVHLVDLLIRRQSLAEGKLTSPSLTCLAEPGEIGRIEVVPHWVKIA